MKTRTEVAVLGWLLTTNLYSVLIKIVALPHRVVLKAAPEAANKLLQLRILFQLQVSKGLLVIDQDEGNLSCACPV